MRVLVACEFSGIVRDAFATRGHDAWSVDILPTERPGQHIEADALYVARVGWGRIASWDMMIAFPPCTHLASSGARWFPKKRANGQQKDAILFALELLKVPIPRIALENPIGILSTEIREPDQIIQPWQFGHGETKATCFWLKNLPPLVPTHTDKSDLFAELAPAEREARVHREPPSPDRWKNRSRTYAGIAAAMASQWGETQSLGR